ncbi:hypothetical protein [Falsiroseomonas sp.]|uniref:hypothetical protein n=1 Tax=Falsiroseomonas sp. TaxID=2870721 RepID=UPI003568B325
MSASDPRTYRFTFGHHLQKDDWSDVQALTWSALADLLTTHIVGPKAGTCIVPAVFSGGRRKKAEAVQIDVAMLDSDSGATLDEIRAAVTARRWAAIISSTHSHLTTRTTVKGTDWQRFQRDHGAAATAEAFLLEQKDYLPRIAAGAKVAAEVGEHVLFEHVPCPKFRIAIPLLRPWRADDHPDTRTAGRAWKGRIEALAAALGLSHDQACTDASRLFFLPRRPADGPPAETAALEGAPCDIFALPDPPDDEPRGTAKRSRQRRAPDPEEALDPQTGKVIDLRSWARRLGQRFLIAKALRARRPAALLGRTIDGTKHLVRCPNEAEHTNAGEDEATFVCDAGSGSEAKGFVIHCRHAHCDGRDRLFFVGRMLQQGWLAGVDLTNPEFLSGNAPVRPLIRMAGGEIAEIVDQAEAALLRADLDLYQRGPFIVRPGRVPVTVADNQEVAGLRAIKVEPHALAEAMTQAATWEKFDARSDSWVQIDAPAKAASTYLQRGGRWKLPVLAGIINAPTLRPDGSLLSRPGYDAATGLLYDPCGTTFPAIRRSPTREHAGKALAALKEPLAGFPFISGASTAVALSAILTACIRRSLRTAPLHAFTAPAAGTGKSKLVDIASVIATGREAGVISQGKTEEEFEKRLGALLLASEGVIAIDNCETPLGGDFLCSMLTQQVVRARILGLSEAPELPSNALVTATGNNLVLAGDVTRRAIVGELDAKVERPELRSFAFDPVDLAKRDRGRLVAAALTVLLAYWAAGRPNPPDPLGSFEEWSGWVRGALIWLDEADPVETMEAARDSDPRLEELRAIMQQWQAVIGCGATSVREIIELATEFSSNGSMGFGAPGRADFRHPDLREALLAVAGRGGAINGARLGKWLGTNADRIVGGLVIRRGSMSTGVQQWVLERVASARPAAAA